MEQSAYKKNFKSEMYEYFNEIERLQILPVPDNNMM